MNLKLKRLVRTPSSEQYALFDLDQLDAAARPSTIGKLDLHFTAEGMYGTLLIWDDGVQNMDVSDRRSFVRALLSDLAQPMGVPNEYVVEFFAPSLELYDVIHNVGLSDEDDEEVEEDYEDEEEAAGSLLDTQANPALALARRSGEGDGYSEIDDDMDDDLDKGIDEEDPESLVQAEYEDEHADIE